MIFSGALAIAGGLLLLVGVICHAIDRMDQIPRGWYFPEHEDRADYDWGEFFDDVV